MKRAAILIGVQRTATLPELSAVWAGVKEMAEWTNKQQIECRSLTDEDGPLRPQDISAAVREFIDPAKRVQQLLVYFAGHGINKNYNEYWLLSDAVDDPNAAVNVLGSIERARYCRVPHVVFISDACRTAVDSIQAAGVEGSIIFPNPPGGPAAGVDVFYATQLGEPAFEINDPAEASTNFTGIYTHVLLEALRGEHRDLAAMDESLGTPVIRAWPLKKFLATELPRRVFRLTAGQNPRSQKPDAIIASPPETWLSALAPSTEPIPLSGEEPDPAATAHAEFISAESSRIKSATYEVLAAEDVVEIGRGAGQTRTTRSNLDVVSGENERFLAQVRENTESFGPTDFKTKCGFKVRNAEITAFKGHGTQYEILEDGHALVAHVADHQCAGTLLSFSNGYHAVLPAIGGFVASVRFQGNVLVDVSFEPAPGTDRWRAYESRGSEIRQLRAVIASSSKLGTFRIDAENAGTLARRMQLAKGVDPALALYAAHAYRDLGLHERIEQMAQFMNDDLGVVLFDIALMAGRLNGKQSAEVEYVRPALPLLSQSWALLSALEVTLPVASSELQRHIHPSSLWTLYNDEAAQLLRPLIESGEIR